MKIVILPACWFQVLSERKYLIVLALTTLLASSGSRRFMRSFASRWLIGANKMPVKYNWSPLSYILWLGEWIIAIRSRPTMHRALSEREPRTQFYFLLLFPSQGILDTLDWTITFNKRGLSRPREGINNACVRQSLRYAVVWLAAARDPSNGNFEASWYDQLICRF